MGVIETLQKTPGAALCWLGNNGWLISGGGHLIATDLDLFLGERTLPPFEELSMLAETLDFLFITHVHGDHLNPDTVGFLQERGKCIFVLPRSCADVAQGVGIASARIRWAEPGTPMRLTPWLSVHPLRAVHGHLHGSVYSGANQQDCGYIITIGGKRIVQPGDTVLLEEHLGLEDVDILFVSPTEHNTCVEQSLTMIEAALPRRVFAQHFGTYRVHEDNAFWTRGYEQELLERLPNALKERYTIPEYLRVYPL